MSDAVIVQLAEAVKDTLNAATLSQAFEAVRAYAAAYELKDMETLHVTVGASAVNAVAESRSSDRFEYAVEVGIQQRFAGGPTEGELDALMLLVEEVVDLFRWKRLAAFAAAACVAVDNAPIYVPEHLAGFNQFTSVVRLTFRTTRTR